MGASANLAASEAITAEPIPPEELEGLDGLGGLEEGAASQGQDRRRISRRAVVQAGLIGGAGIAALPLLALVRDLTKSRPNVINFRYPLNNDWLFGGPYQVGSEAEAFDDSGFAPITLPHTATKTAQTTQTTQVQQNATQTAQTTQAQTAQTGQLSWRNWNPWSWQHMWIYRRYLDVTGLKKAGAHLIGSVSKQDPKPANRVFADFDGVMVSSTVVCNGQVVATHQGGYLPFSAELTGLLTTGKNVLAVIVDAHSLPVPPMIEGYSPSSIDFLQPGGIYRDVSLRIVPQIFVSDLYATPAGVLTDQPEVTVQCTIDAALIPKSKATLTVELLDTTNTADADSAPAIASIAGSVHITQTGVATASLTLSGFGKVQLWSPGTPALYTVRATIDVPGIGAHAATRRIGFREAVFKPEGFFLNGQRLQIFGLDRHQLYPYTGMAMPARVQRKDAEILKNDFNCNMVRCSHYPQSPHFLDACDELGLLVWEEAPGWDRVSTRPAWQDQVIQNVKDMVTRDRNRPSVIIWGTRLNETGDYPGLWAATRQAAKALDPTRPSSGAMDRHDATNWAEDVFAFNDYSFTPATDYATLLPPLPDVPYLVTESVGVVETHPQHFTWTDPPALLAKQAALHAQAHSAAGNPGYAGLLGWAGFDYASLRGGRPDNVKWAGVADGFRVPKLGAAIYQSQVDPKVRPVIVPVFFWEQGGQQPAEPAVGLETMIASNCEQLEILLDGQHVTSALPAKGSPLYQNLPYPPFFITLPPLPGSSRTPGGKTAPGSKPVSGATSKTALPTSPTPELTIIGYVGGKQVAKLTMSADPARDHLVMTADDTVITADGTDATRVVFRGVDAHGNQRRTQTGQVALSVTGPAVLLGDNPFAFGTYGGLGAVWVRSVAGQFGEIAIVATHPTLGTARVEISAVRSSEATPV
jgi:beta-galactosidase